jgi:F-type H+-transporting ATPase subunit alpha
MLALKGAYSIVVNINRGNRSSLNLGCLSLSFTDLINVGGEVIATGSLLTIPSGNHCLGSIVDPIGTLILGASKITHGYVRWLVESSSPGIIDRETVFEPLSTGLLSIDSLIPIGRGQRELIVGDRQTGKTAIGMDVMINQFKEEVLSIYVPIGQKASSVIGLYWTLLRREVTSKICIVCATAGSCSVSQYMSCYSGTSIGEYFMYVRSSPCFTMQDNLSCQAVSYREISLLLGRPPGREAYPGEIFFVHSRLLERSSKLCPSLGSGSISSFPVVETLASDVSSFITTNVISITDGQLFLSLDLFISGVKPAIDVGLSVSRVGSSAQWDGMKSVSGTYKLDLAQYAELESFSQFSSDLGPETKLRINRGRSLVELLKQPAGCPLSLSSQVLLLSITESGIFNELNSTQIRTITSRARLLPYWMLLVVPNTLIFSGLLI